MTITAVNRTHAVAAGGTVASGRLIVQPAWRSSMTAGTWATVSASVMADVDPDDDAGVNPATPGTAPWKGSDGQRAIIDGWGSSVWDESTLTLYVPIGGGHGNYGGNEGYKQRLGDDSPAWVRMNDPSGALTETPGINLGDGLEATGVYADGRPRSPHVYNNAAIATGIGPVITAIAAPYPNANAASGKVFLVNPTTGDHSLVFDFNDATLCGLPGGVWPDGSPGPNQINGSACYDATRNRIWNVPTGNNSTLTYCTPSASPGTWAGGYVGSPFYAPDSFHGIVHWPDGDRLLLMTPDTGVAALYLINPTTGARSTARTLSGSPPTGFSAASMWGFDWCPELGKLLLWNQTSNTTVIGTLTPVGDGLTEWTWGSLTVDGSNAVTPPVRASQGTFGLFRYSSALKGCYLVTDHLEATHFFATE